MRSIRKAIWEIAARRGQLALGPRLSPFAQSRLQHPGQGVDRGLAGVGRHLFQRPTGADLALEPVGGAVKSADPDRLVDDHRP